MYGVLDDKSLDRSIRRAILIFRKDRKPETKYYSIKPDGGLHATNWSQTDEAHYEVTDKRTQKKYYARYCKTSALYTGGKGQTFWVIGELIEGDED